MNPGINLSLFFQQGPAETTNFMVLGFAVIFGTMLLHLVSLNSRRRNMQRDLDLLEEIEKDKS